MIVFFVLCMSDTNTGMGGHYYSLLHTATELERMGEPCRIVVFGDMRPRALAGRDHDFYPRTDAGMAQFKRDFAPRMPQVRVFHAFSELTGAFCQGPLREYGKPFVVTKPGKPPMSWRRDRFRNMVFFQQSEFDAERRLAGRWGVYNPALIPNRISPALIRGTGRTSPFGGGAGLKILRIGRINATYNGVVRQSVNLMRRLQSLGHDAELAVVGTVEDPAALDDLRAEGWADVTLRTTEDFTRDAVQLIPFADIVVGIGRGAMEATVHRKPTFVSGTDPALPIFLDDASFPAALAHNFSQRTPATGPCAPEAAFARFLPLLESEAARAEYRAFQDRAADRHLDASAGARALMAYYATCRPDRWYDKTVMRAFRLASRLRGITGR